MIYFFKLKWLCNKAVKFYFQQIVLHRPFKFRNVKANNFKRNWHNTMLFRLLDVSFVRCLDISKFQNHFFRMNRLFLETYEDTNNSLGAGAFLFLLPIVYEGLQSL